jgi:Fic family protein
MYGDFRKIISVKFFANEVVLSWLKTELTYTSNYIEGNTLTRQETALVVEEGIVSGSKPLKDYVEARNHAMAFDYIISLKDQPIDSYEKVILKIHECILNGINDADKGKYRNMPVRISGSNAILPNPLKVPDLMEQLSVMLDCKEDSVLKAIEAHYKLVAIHPFIDGNGRTARLLMNLILIRAGIVPLIIQPIERKRYINSINLRNVSGKSLQYFRYMVKQLSKSTIAFEKAFGETTNHVDSTELMKISEFARFCGVPVSTIRYYLRVKKLIPTAYTNAGYMLFTKEQAKIVSLRNGNTIESSTP